MRNPAAILGLCAAALLIGCAGEQPELAVASPDMAIFQTQVYPILMRDCAFSACHGSSKRFFQVLGPGRGRLLPTTKPLDPMTPEEISYSYNRTRSMIDANDPQKSLLLRKPLATSAGGVGHEGVDALDRNVYGSKADPSYVILASWVLAQPAITPQP